MTLFSEKFLDIISQHVSDKIETCNNKDAPWITREVKTTIKRNARIYQKWVIYGRDPNTHDKIRELQNLTKQNDKTGLNKITSTNLVKSFPIPI